jgi:hypothetical protein
MDLNARITALEGQVEGIRPAVIGEDDIVEAMAGLDEGVPAAPYHVEALYRLILPGLHGAMTRGANTLDFFREWGIDRPAPVGPIDSLATALSRGGLQ